MATFSKRAGKWRVQVRRRGVTRSATFYTKGEAREWATQIEREIDTGQLGSRATVTLGEAFERYADEVSPQKRGSRWEKVRLAKMGRDALADVRFRDLTPEHIEKWRDRRSQEVSAGSVNREMNLLKSVLRQSREVWGWIDDAPEKKVRRLPSPPARDRRISDDEVQRICWALEFDGERVETRSQEVAVAFLLALETGMRLGEIVGIRRQDLKGRSVHLARTKNASPRSVPLPRRAIELLDLLPGQPGTDWIFRVTSETASSLFRRGRLRAGIHDLTFHDSRHEACTRLARKLDILDLARMIGHTDIRSLRTYYNPTAEEIADRLDAADGPTSPPRPGTTEGTDQS